MKPDWDKLMEDFAGSPTALVADVDCTTEGKDLCSKHDVRGYPSIKHGDPNNLQEYDGGRSYDDFKQFADENLGPSCSPDNLDLCDADKRALMEKFMKMSAGKIDAKIRKATKDMEKMETDYKTFVDSLQEQYKMEEEKKEAALKDIKESGLGLMKAVATHRSKEL